MHIYHGQFLIGLNINTSTGTHMDAPSSRQKLKENSAPKPKMIRSEIAIYNIIYIHKMSTAKQDN
jgi:hypothetical protein